MNSPPESSANDPIQSQVTQQSSAGKTFPCDGCGADLTFDVDAQSLKCPFCHYKKELESADGDVEEQDFLATLERLQRNRQKGRTQATDVHEVTCDSCGANVSFQGTLTSSACVYCGSPIQREGIHDAEDRIPVDGVVPFLVERSTAQKNLKQWIQSRWFLPGDFKRRGIQGDFQGIYLPYWTFDALTVNSYRGERGDYYWVTVGTGKNKSRVRHTRWSSASGHFRRFFDDVLALASGGLSKKLIRALEPWPLDKSQPFQPEYLAGYLAKTYDIPLENGFETARKRMDEAIAQLVRQKIGGDTQRIHSIQTSLPALTYKHMLLPVWLLGYRYKGKTYQIAINAASGEVQGERPWSVIKITLLIAAVAVVVAGIVLAVNT